MKPNVCLDVTAIAVLHTTPLPLFLGHPSLHDLVDRVDTVAMAVVQQHRETLKVCTDMCNAPISRRNIRAPLDIAREVGRQQLFWKPLFTCVCRLGLCDSRPKGTVRKTIDKTLKKQQHFLASCF